MTNPTNMSAWMIIIVQRSTLWTEKFCRLASFISFSFVWKESPYRLPSLLAEINYSLGTSFVRESRTHRVGQSGIDFAARPNALPMFMSLNVLESRQELLSVSLSFPLTVFLPGLLGASFPLS